MLIGVVCSEYAERALKQAIENAKGFSAHITAANTCHAPAGQDVSQSILNEARPILESADVRVNVIFVLSPTTPKLITDMAGDEDFDSVKVGSREIGAIHTLLVGSICNGICYNSSISFLIVK